MNIINDYLWYYTMNNLEIIKETYSLYGIDLSQFILVINELKYKNPIPLYKEIFGDNFKSIIPNSIEPKKFQYKHIDNILYKAMYYDNESNIVIKNENGFAEYYDKDIYNLENNTLILYDNEAMRNKYDFDATLVHEIFGHKKFYSYITDSFKKNHGLFDNGAIAFIEGYATYCEWNITKNNHTTLLRERAINILNIDISDIPYKEKANLIYEINLKYGYNEDICIQGRHNYYQYPGFSSLYYLGALSFEEYLKNNIDDPLKRIKEKNILSDSLFKSILL